MSDSSELTHGFFSSFSLGDDSFRTRTAAVIPMAHSIRHIIFAMNVEPEDCEHFYLIISLAHSFKVYRAVAACDIIFIMMRLI